MRNIRKYFTDSAIHALLLLLVSLAFLHNIVSSSSIMNSVHHINDVTFVSHNLKESLFKYKEPYLWTPYYYSGQPLYAQPEYYFFDLNFWYILLFHDIFIAMNLSTITYFFLSGLGMYLLFLTFKDERKGALIAALLYMLNGYMHTFVIGGNINVIAGYSLIPFAFMFFVKALKSEFLKNSMLSGIFIAFQLFAGGTLLIPYEIIIFSAYGAFYIFGSSPGKKLIRLAAVVTILGAAAFGLSAVKLLPDLEFMELSNRNSGVPYQEYLGYPVQISSLPHIFVSNLLSSGISSSIGIAGFILFIFGLRNFRKKYILFSIFMIILSLFMSANSFLSDFLFKVPVFNQLRHIERGIFLIAIAAPIIAGSAYYDAAERIKKFTKIKKEGIIFFLIIIFIIVELMLLQYFPQSSKITSSNEIPVNDYIGKDKTYFRTINLALHDMVGASGYNYLAQIGIGEIKGGSGIWFNDYLTYLSIAQQSDPAKLWGILNNKYVISDRELNISGLQLVDKFQDCKDCTLWEAYGPYLYKNSEAVPRAYVTNDAILILGSGQNSQQMGYYIILDKKFNPQKMVTITSKKTLKDYSLEEIKRYSVLIITEQIDGSSVQLLKDFTLQGGKILPDIINGKNSISPGEIEIALSELDGKSEEIKIKNYESNKIVYDTKGKNGFLVLSERFAHFPGWTASGNGNKEILKSNVVITSVYTENDDEITLRYMPNSFVRGSIISFITLLLILSAFAYIKMKKSGDKNKI